MHTVDITADHVRAARHMLHWKQSDLAERAGVSRVTISDLESGRLDPRVSTMRAIKMVFEREGIELTDNGVQRRRSA